MDKFLSWLRNIKLPLPKGFRLPQLRGISTRLIVLWGIALLVAVGAFIFVRSFTACWQLTELPGMRPSTCPGTTSQTGDGFIVNAQGTPELPPPTPEEVAAPPVEYPQWDGGSRINIVFFGLRGGETAGEDCPLCTDTIIVFTVDPVTKTAGMISVPRDMFVNIPGFGYSRINTAWTSGEGAKLPGGGPGLAMRTVSQFLGVPIQYYVQVSFDTFTSFINMIGGIDVYNDEKLILDPSGSGLDHFKLTCCGIRHLDGKLALAYSRTRHTKDGDVDRSRRQQKVILAIRDKVLSPSEFPTL